MGERFILTCVAKRKKQYVSKATNIPNYMAITCSPVSTMHTPSFGEDWGGLSIPIHLGRYPHMCLEETVEERHILKAQRDGYFLDSQRGDL